jgi:DNA-binding NarL/FixJ family response regulator
MRSYTEPQGQSTVLTIADELQLSEGTVKIHLHNIYRKLGIRNRVALLYTERPVADG